MHFNFMYNFIIINKFQHNMIKTQLAQKANNNFQQPRYQHNFHKLQQSKPKVNKSGHFTLSAQHLKIQSQF